MKHFWKRLIASMLTVVMLVSVLPPTALAALVDNTPDQNEVILQELTAFWGDEKTAQEAMELLRRYNLIDEDGSILTDWSGTITIEEEARALTFSDAMDLTSGTVTVNGRACDAAELNAILRQMEAMGLLADGQIVADWQIEVTDEAETADELETPPAVKVLDQEVDAAALQEITGFLEEYGPLTETGCLTDWDITQPGESRPSNVTALLALLEDETTDRSMVVTVDGTPITLGEFETMMEIEAEIKRIQDTYLQENVDLTPEQASSLYSLYEQLSENGIMLYNTQGADDLVFPSGINHQATVSMKVESNGDATYTVSGAADDQVISFDVYVIPASASAVLDAKEEHVTITGNGSARVSQPYPQIPDGWDGQNIWNGEQAFYYYASNIQNAVFEGGKLSYKKELTYYKNASFPSKIEISSTTNKTVNFTDAEKYFPKNLASHYDWSVSVSSTKKATVYSSTSKGGKTDAYNVYYQYLNSGIFFGNDCLAGVEAGYKDRASSLGLRNSFSMAKDATRNFYCSVNYYEYGGRINEPSDKKKAWERLRCIGDHNASIGSQKMYVVKGKVITLPNTT